jgi:hypothetical protein
VTERTRCWGLIVGDQDDPHVRAIVERCPAPGLIVTDASSVSAALARLDVTTTQLRDVDGNPCTLDPTSTTRGWLRRLAPEDWDLNTVMGSQRAAVMASRLNLLGAVIRDPSVRWLTEVDALFAAENKIVQLRTATAMGLRTPATAISNDVTRLSDLGESMVVKPLGPGHYLDADGQMQVVHATLTTADRLVGVDLSDAPFLAQERIEVRRPRQVPLQPGAFVDCRVGAQTYRRAALRIQQSGLADRRRRSRVH